MTRRDADEHEAEEDARRTAWKRNRLYSHIGIIFISVAAVLVAASLLLYGIVQDVHGRRETAPPPRPTVVPPPPPQPKF